MEEPEKMKDPIVPPASPPTASPQPFILETRAGRAPIIDGSRFKYDEGFVSSSEEEEQEEEVEQGSGLALQQDVTGESIGDMESEWVKGGELEVDEYGQIRPQQIMEPAKPFYYPSIQVRLTSSILKSLIKR